MKQALKRKTTCPPVKCKCSNAAISTTFVKQSVLGTRFHDYTSIYVHYAKSTPCSASKHKPEKYLPESAAKTVKMTKGRLISLVIFNQTARESHCRHKAVWSLTLLEGPCVNSIDCMDTQTDNRMGNTANIKRELNYHSQLTWRTNGLPGALTQQFNYCLLLATD